MSLADWYANPIPTRFLAPIDCSKFQHRFHLQSLITFDNGTKKNNKFWLSLWFGPVPHPPGYRSKHVSICYAESRSTKRHGRGGGGGNVAMGEMGRGKGYWETQIRCGVRSSWEGRYTLLFLLYPYMCFRQSAGCHPQSTQSGIDLMYIPSWWKNQPRLVRVGGAHPPPSHYIYHLLQSCGISSSCEGIYTPYFHHGVHIG